MLLFGEIRQNLHSAQKLSQRNSPSVFVLQYKRCKLLISDYFDWVDAVSSDSDASAFSVLYVLSPSSSSDGKEVVKIVLVVPASNTRYMERAR